jgi:DNA polymerase IV
VSELRIDRPPTPPGRSILLLDCDAFFVQVARLEDPEGLGGVERLLVGGRSGRGVVTSASYAVRAFGVRSGMPVAEALRRCPDAVVVPVPREACTARSRAIRSELERLAPVVQAASIDEFYLDLTGTHRLFGGASLAGTAARIRARVHEVTGITVSIGGGSNRLVAKLAAGRAKPHREGDPGPHPGVFIVPAGGEAAFMAELDVRAIPGVGPALAGELEARGIVSVPELLAVESAWLARWVGEGRAAGLRARARGEDDAPVTPAEERKSISAERTWGEDVPPGPAGDVELERKLLELAGTVGATLRGKGFRARTITVKLRDGDFSTRQRSRTLAEPVESDRAIYEAGRAMLRELRARRRPTRLLGIGVAGLEHEGGTEQLDLLGPEDPGAPARPETERDRTLSRVADQVRARFGDDALRPGRIMEENDG